MARVLVTEKITASALDILTAAGHNVDVQLGLDPAQLLDAVAGAAALVVRSETQVTDDVLTAGAELIVVGRAGVGVDNIDVTSATSRGVMVANAPGSNATSAAEHAFALLLAQARNIPQADVALKTGSWERSRWTGVELAGKTLVVLGLGRIGTMVADRARAFGMDVLVWDPWMPKGAPCAYQVLDSLDDALARADFITIHLMKTPETVGLIDDDALTRVKPNLRIVNAARGGIIDEAALSQALTDGRIAGAALDVFDIEPCTDSPLFAHPNVIVTPHLAASTPEAQTLAGEMVAEQVVLALGGEFVPYAVNVDARAASNSVAPYVALAERLGAILADLNDTTPAVVEITVAGEIAGFDTSLANLAFLRGLLGSNGGDPVTYVNASKVAAERCVQLVERRADTTGGYVSLLTVAAGGHSIAATFAGPHHAARIVAWDGHAVEVPTAAHMLVVENDDRTGMVALVAGALADDGVNIANLHLGRSAPGQAALQVITLDCPAPDNVVAHLAATDGVLGAYAVNI